MQHHIILTIVGCVFAGIVLGYIFRAWIGSEVLATEAELTMWRTRLEKAAIAEEQIAKREASSIATEIRAKIHL
jgi:hypothetical protein